MGIRLPVVALLLCALGASGCALNTTSGIDPSGEHIFAPWPAPAAVPAPAPVPAPVPVAAPVAASGPYYWDQPGAPRPWDDVAVSLSPRTTVAPIGTEVVLLAGVRGGADYLMTNRRLEWSLDSGGVGHFVDVGGKGFVDWLLGDFTQPRIVDNTHAIGDTSRHYLRLTRGTPTPNDDVLVLAGQGWITVTSPVEGTSHVTVFAPTVYPWDARTQSATIHWIDAQWVFPPPAINPTGTRHVFATTVMRQSNQCPCVGWFVRYAILDGPAAGFAPDGAPALEVMTDQTGQARAEIFQKQPCPGTNKVGIQIIRPGNFPGADGVRLPIGNGVTLKTWTAPALAVHKAGPAVGAVGAVLGYRTEVSNPGDQPARDVLVTEQVPDGLSFLNSNPPAEVAGRTLQWRLGTLGGGQRLAIDVNYRAERPGSVTDCAEAVAAGGLKAADCATTSISAAVAPLTTPPSIAPGAPPAATGVGPPGAPATGLELRVTGPPQVNVGSEVTFEILISNRSQVPATNVVIKDTFDAGLVEARHLQTIPIERKLPQPLAPGQSQAIHVTFRATKAGRLCHTVEVTADNGLRAAPQEACVTAVEAGAPPPAAAGPATPPTFPVPSTPQFAVSVKTFGGADLAVGETAGFTIDISNKSDRALSNLGVVAQYDTSLHPTAATLGHKAQNKSLLWTIDTLPAGKADELKIVCRCEAAAVRACVRVTVNASDGGKAEGEACVAIRETAGGAAPGTTAPRESPPGPKTGGLTMTVEALTKPIAVGKELTYEIRVSNEGTTPDRLVSLSVNMPAGMVPVPLGTTGPPLARPTINKQTIRFDPVTEIGTGETLVYRVRARTKQPGSARLTAEVTSLNQPRPIVKEETIEVIP